MPKFNEWFFGKKGKAKQLKTTDPMQEQLLSLINEGLTSGTAALSDIFGSFNQGEFEKGVSEPALKNFKENILPALQEKFISNNQLLGSDFARASNKAGTDLQSQLAQLMYQAQQQQKQNKITGTQTALGKQTRENIFQPGSKGVLQGVLEGAANSLGSIITGAAGGGGGGAAPAATPGAGNAAFGAKAAHIAG